MSEIGSNFAREWVEFVNPENPNEMFKCDLTWLTSYWNCIFGQGCQGIDKELSDHGCCSDGAYYYDKEDEVRVTTAAKRLPKTMWQNFEVARNGKFNITEQGLDRDRKTKKINKTCIFFNESDFTNEYFGCALHHLALAEDKHFAETKPDICWQLPLRRSWESRNVGDRKYDVIVIGEYTREAWGEGGADMDWYCSSNSEAHNGAEPVYISHKTELIKLMNKSAYETLAQLCNVRIEAQKNRKVKHLPLFVIHPATKAAKR